MESVQGLVIRTADYKEKDKILTVFTARGLLTVTAKGVRSAKSKLKAYASVLTFGEIGYTGREGNRVLAGVECIDNFYAAWGDLKKISALYACFELAEKGFREEDETGSEFVFLLRTVKETVYGQTDPICMAFRFFIFCAQRLGVDYTEIEGYDVTSYNVINTFAVADPEECGTLPYTEEKVRKAFLLLHNVYKNRLDLKINALKTLLN